VAALPELLMPDAPPMAGCVVLVTADRRADQLTALFQRNGAIVRHVPVVSHVPITDDTELLDRTAELIADPPDLVVSTTGIGFRGWLEAADAAGLGQGLSVALRSATMIARGSKSRGAIQAAGYTADWVAPGETASEIIAELTRRDVAGKRIAVQHHGTGSDGLDESLQAAGAKVISLTAYRLGQAPDREAVAESVRTAAAGQVDVVVFTSAPGALAWLKEARCEYADVAARMRDGSLLGAAVGPVTAAPLVELGVQPLVPDRSRLGALVRTVVDHYHALPGLDTPAGRLHLRRTGAVLDGRVVQLTPAGMAVLRLLAERSGAVVSRAEVLAALPGSSRDNHAAEVAVSRLRESLRDPRVVRTVVKRGYCLDVAS